MVLSKGTLVQCTVLLVPTVVDCGYWLVGGRKLCEFKVRNDGGEGRFAIVPAASWPAINFKVLLVLISNIRLH